MGTPEIARAIALIGWHPQRLAQVTDADLSQPITDPDIIRRIRALALCPAIQQKVAEWRAFFPDIKLIAAREIGD